MTSPTATQNPSKTSQTRAPSKTYEVIVRLKKEVLDPEGRAIRESLQRLGHSELVDVKVTKRFLIDLKDAPESLANAERIAAEFLANPVSESFSVRELS